MSSDSVHPLAARVEETFVDALTGDECEKKTLSKHQKYALKPLSESSFNALHALYRIGKKREGLAESISQCRLNHFPKFQASVFVCLTVCLFVIRIAFWQPAFFEPPSIMFPHT